MELHIKEHLHALETRIREELAPVPLRPGEARFVKRVAPALAEAGIIGPFALLPAFFFGPALYWFLVGIWCFSFGVASLVYVFRVGHELHDPNATWWRTSAFLGAFNVLAFLFVFGLLLDAGCMGPSAWPWNCG